MDERIVETIPSAHRHFHSDLCTFKAAPDMTPEEIQVKGLNVSVPFRSFEANGHPRSSKLARKYENSGKQMLNDIKVSSIIIEQPRPGAKSSC
jgi:hypothetical protein